MSKIKRNNLRKYRVKSLSGLRGWRQRLQGVYRNFSEFLAYCGVYNNHVTLGYKTEEEAWRDNPIVEGSCSLSDYRNVSTGFHFAD